MTTVFLRVSFPDWVKGKQQERRHLGGFPMFILWFVDPLLNSSKLGRLSASSYQHRQPMDIMMYNLVDIPKGIAAKRLETLGGTCRNKTKNKLQLKSLAGWKLSRFNTCEPPSPKKKQNKRTLGASQKEHICPSHI